jgi:arylsulfatase A-like enzyme
MKTWMLWGLLTATVVSAHAQSGSESSLAGPSQPNVLLVMLDDQNDYLGFLGGLEQARSPHMDRLAAKGIVFEQAYCSSPICAPSRTSMLTGKDPNYTQVYNNSVDYHPYPQFRDLFGPATNNETVYTLPEILKDSMGYFTANFYKIYHGWYDISFDNDYDAATSDPCQRGLSWNLFMDRNGKTQDVKPSPDFGEAKEGVAGLQHSRLANSREDQTNDVIMVDSAIAFLDRYAADPGRYCDRPFFAAVGMYRPHAPWFIAERYYDTWFNPDYAEQSYRVPFNEPNERWPPNGLQQPGFAENSGQDYDHLSDIAKSIASGSDFSWDAIAAFAEELDAILPADAQWTQEERVERLARAIRANATLAYLAASTYADAQFGRLWQALESHPELSDNTIILLVSDHGYSMGEHRHFHKASMWETDLRVPFVVYDPRNPSPKRVHGVVSLLDLMPTVLELLDGPDLTMPNGEAYPDGYALQPMMSDPSLELQRPALSGIRYQTGGQELLCGPQFSVRSSRYHYIHYREPSAAGSCDSPGVLRELYEIGPNRQVDPEEWNNLASDPRYASTMDYLSQWLPGGPLHKKAVPKLRIADQQVPCTLNSNDTLRVSVAFGDEWGRPMLPDTASFGFRWTLEELGLHLDGPEAQFALLGVDTTATELLVTLQAWPLADSAYVLVDQRRFAFGPSFDPGFSVALDSNSLQVSNYEVPKDHVFTQWDYGDGLLRQGKHPNVHAYSAPGTYRLTRFVRYGPQGQCTDTASRSTVVKDSLFALSACPAPTAQWLDSVSSRQAMLRWSPSANATAYRVFYRSSENGWFSDWDSVEASGTEKLLRALDTETRYEARISARCATSDAPRSYPVEWTTAPCSPPSGFALEVDSSNLNWSWTLGTGDTVIGQRFWMVVDETFHGNKAFRPHLSKHSFPRPPNGTLFDIAAITICAQVDGSWQAGPFSDTLRFIAPLPVARQAPKALHVYPNPTEAQVRVVWPAEGSWTLSDVWGRLLQDGFAQPGESIVDLYAYPSGTYLLHWQGANETRQSLVVKDMDGRLR